MVVGIIGRKLGMTQKFDENGICTPVTVVKAGPCKITQIKTSDKEGYNALQLGFEPAKPQRTKRPILGHYKKGGLEPMRVLREFKVADTAEYEVGQDITCEQFEEGVWLDATANSKGRGFTGVMKRWGHHGGKATHGVHEIYRGGGAIGMSSDPGKVMKGMKMPGQYGNTRVTQKNLMVVGVNVEDSILLLRGTIPGPVGGLVVLNPAKTPKQAKKS